MTGIYVRVRRDNGWEHVEFDRLADAEMDAFIARALNDPRCDRSEGWRYSRMLAEWIRDNVDAKDPAEGWQFAKALAAWVRDRGKGERVADRIDVCNLCGDPKCTGLTCTGNDEPPGGGPT